MNSLTVASEVSALIVKTPSDPIEIHRGPADCFSNTKIVARPDARATAHALERIKVD